MLSSISWTMTLLFSLACMISIHFLYENHSISGTRYETIKVLFTYMQSYNIIYSPPFFPSVRRLEYVRLTRLRQVWKYNYVVVYIMGEIISSKIKYQKTLKTVRWLVYTAVINCIQTVIVFILYLFYSKQHVVCWFFSLLWQCMNQVSENFEDC